MRPKETKFFHGPAILLLILAVLVSACGNSVESLIEKLKDPDREVRIAAAKELGEKKDNQAIRPLIVMLNDDNPAAQQAAMDALENIGGWTATQAVSHKKRFEKALVLSRDPSWEKRKLAAESIGSLRHPGALEALAAMLEDENIEVSFAALNSLALRQESKIVPIIVRAVKNMSSKDKYYAFCALACAERPGIEALIAFLDDPDPKTRRMASLVMGSGILLLPEDLDSKAATALVAQLQDDDPILRQTAAVTLGRLQCNDTIDPLIKALGDKDRQVRILAATALSGCQDPRVLEALENLDPDLKEPVKKQVALEKKFFTDSKKKVQAADRARLSP